MHTVKRAIILAAGKGTRLHPVTLFTPKPLVEVNGTRMIDTIIDALHQNGIKEIYIVVGYLKDQFSGLQKQYPGIKLIYNPYYDTCNNISSLYVARNYINDAFILDGDLIVRNPKVLSVEFQHSGYNAIWSEERTNEWLMKENNGFVTSCNRNGGEKGWQLFSISRWNKEDGIKLKHHLESEFELNLNRQIYWDDIPMFVHSSDYKLAITEMNKNDVLEIDSINELAIIDTSYIKYIENIGETI